MNRTKSTMAALALCVAAALAFGQDTARSSTTGKYRIALVAPIEGASVPADQVRVVLTPNTSAMGDDKTQVDVWLDGRQKGVINATETDFRVDGVTPGAHKLVLIARNPVTDQQFDRREINFTATGDGSATTTSSMATSTGERAVGGHVPPAVSSTERQHSYMATEPSASAKREQSASAVPPSGSSSSSSSSTYSSSTYSDNGGSSNRPSSGSASSYSSSSSTSDLSTSRMPKTATSDALLALAGAALLATGVLLRRNA
jgi:LPXTG-motif cell wall-anchored protein